jgi:methylmalonyl-CoA epimerase
MIGSRVDHVGMVVDSLETARPLFEALSGTTASDIVEIPEMGLRLSFVGGFELMQPTDAESLVGQFLERHGPSAHHVAFRVPDLPEALDRLKQADVALFDEVPRMGAQGHRIAFLHPRSTGGTLIEVVERSDH